MLVHHNNPDADTKFIFINWFFLEQVRQVWLSCSPILTKMHEDRINYLSTWLAIHDQLPGSACQ